MAAYLFSRLSHSQKCVDFCKLRVYHRGISTSLQCFDEMFDIPKRIPRSPTSILEALASTVSTDTSGPHYKYMDDPYLTPTANQSKRNYALSKESGRKSARWIASKYPRLFDHYSDDPVIKAYHNLRPRKIEISEAALEDLIQNFHVSNAILGFKRCQRANIKLSNKIHRDLLELVCYYNCEDTLPEELIEERWYQQSVNINTNMKRWKNFGFAEELFNKLSEKDSRAYCAIIRGMASYNEVLKALKLYNQANCDGVPLDTETYNAVIRSMGNMQKSFSYTWISVKDMLIAMSEKGIKPNLGTLNSLLEVLVMFKIPEMPEERSLQILAEFKSIGIEPTLATFYFLLLIHCRGNKRSTILFKILDYIEGRNFEVTHLKDTSFFVTAMDICCNHIMDVNAAHRVHKYLCSGNNYKLVGDAFKESIYYRHYFTAICRYSSVETIMQFYNDLTPHVYTPEPRVFALILEKMKKDIVHQYLPQLWTDLQLSKMDRNVMVLTKFLNILASYIPNADKMQLTEQFGDIALVLWKLYNDLPTTFKSMWSSDMMSDLIISSVNCGKYDVAVKVFKNVFQSENVVAGPASYRALSLLCRAAVGNKDNSQAVDVAVYAVHEQYTEARGLANEVTANLELTSEEISKINSVITNEIFGET